jgi:hypothetical protein
LQRTLGNARLQRLLENGAARPQGVVQRDFLSNLWDMASGAASAVGDALTGAGAAIADPASAISTGGGTGEVVTVTDADARLRTDPPGLKNTGATFPKGSNVQIIGTAKKDGLRYVHVKQVMDEGAYGPALSGWTRRSNLDLSSASGDVSTEKMDIATPMASDESNIPGLSSTPGIDHPAFHEIMDLLAEMEASPVPVETHHREEVGEARQQRVDQIREVRARIAALTPEDLNVPDHVFQSGIAYLYRRLAPLAPYYNQIANTNIFGKGDKKGWQRTCNLATPAMIVEGLGLSKEDYGGQYGDVSFLQQIFEALEGKYLARAHYEAAADFEALRLPDFMALVGIARKMPKDAMTFSPDKFDNAVSKARAAAASATTSHETMTTLMTTFGANSVQGWIHYGKLEKIGTARRDYTRILLGTGGKDRDAKKAKYDAMEDKADEMLPVKVYRQSVLTEINPLLDAGAQILVGMENHFVRLDALGEEAVQIDDPGYGTLKNARLTWKQARDFGMFKSYWSVTA